MGKLILLGILGFVIWWMWRKWRLPAAPRNEAPQVRPAESMVSCARCGLHQPRGECIESNGSYYCCEAHRRESEAVTGGREP